MMPRFFQRPLRQRGHAMKHIPRKRFGQHFLSDEAVIDAIVRAIAPCPGQAVVEIGPGLAALTQPLLQRLGRLTVIELDRDLAARLRGQPHLHVIESDVLKVDFAQLARDLAAQTPAGTPAENARPSQAACLRQPALQHLHAHPLSPAALRARH